MAIAAGEDAVFGGRRRQGSEIGSARSQAKHVRLAGRNRPLH